MINTETKKEIFKEFGGTEANTGSIEAQIALFSSRIKHITEHLKSNKKDYSSTRALIALVGKRKKLLKYLAKSEITRYRAIIEKLNLRK